MAAFEYGGHFHKRQCDFSAVFQLTLEALSLIIHILGSTKISRNVVTLIAIGE